MVGHRGAVYSEIRVIRVGGRIDMGQDETKDEMLTMREASRPLNVHSNTLRGWDKQGLLKASRINSRGDRRFKKEDVKALLKR